MEVGAVVLVMGVEMCSRTTFPVVHSSNPQVLSISPLLVFYLAIFWLFYALFFSRYLFLFFFYFLSFGMRSEITFLLDGFFGCFSVTQTRLAVYR